MFASIVFRTQWALKDDIESFINHKLEQLSCFQNRIPNKGNPSSTTCRNCRSHKPQKYYSNHHLHSHTIWQRKSLGITPKKSCPQNRKLNLETCNRDCIGCNEWWEDLCIWWSRDLEKVKISSTMDVEIASHWTTVYKLTKNNAMSSKDWRTCLPRSQYAFHLDIKDTSYNSS